jgi:hypothetical protein
VLLGVDATVPGQSSVRALAWIFLQPYAEYLADHREAAIVDELATTTIPYGRANLATRNYK